MPSKLRDPKQALGEYLDEMLHQATAETRSRPVVDDGNRVLLPRELLAGKPVGDKPPQTVDVTEQADSQEDEPARQPQARLEFPLQCLMFRVGAHLLSVPLIQLSSVVSWEGALTRLPESPQWMLGLVKHRNVNLRVVDSALLLNIGNSSEHGPDHLLVLDDGNWAITCDRLEQVINLDYDDIQWQRGDSERLVLGTIRESLSTLLNPPGISELLNSRQPVTAGG